MSGSLASLLHREERLFALLEGNGQGTVHWGENAAGSAQALSFRKFHFPRAKAPSAWNDFPGEASWLFGANESFARASLAGPVLPSPGAAPISDRSAWDRLCRMAEEAIAHGRLQKLVPARAMAFPITPVEYAALLAAIPGLLFAPAMENAFRFLLKSKASVFFGATPELLFRRDFGNILVPAIAGTRALLPEKSEDELHRELLASAKDRAEHQMVVDGIREALAGLGLTPQFAPEPKVLRVPRLLHLYTPVTATDNPSLRGEALRDALHPTPAIGGLPRRNAASFLFDHEDWDRGLFSAPLLYRTPGRELCLVAIRSALLTPDQLYFFAGAGYVKGSTPEAEWEETERKLQVMRTVLFGDPHGRK